MALLALFPGVPLPLPLSRMLPRVLSSVAAAAFGARCFGGDISAAEASLARAKKYKEERERQASSADVPADAPPPSRLAAACDEEQEAYFMSAPSGLGALAENQIRAAIKEGALDNLKGAGKPLSAEDHSTQFYLVDPLMQAMARTMGAQSVRPESLDRRDEVLRALADFRRQVEAAVAKAVQGGQWGEQQTGAAAVREGTASSVPQQIIDASSSSGAGFFSQLLKLAPKDPQVAAAQCGAGGRCAFTLEGLRAGQHEGLRLALEECNALVKQYNSAVLQDKETWAHWPLNQHPRLTMSAEVDRALQDLGSQQSGGGGGSRGGS